MKIVHEGMRETVTLNGGTARPLEQKMSPLQPNRGTAEVGAGNAYKLVGGRFWPMRSLGMHSS